MNIPPRIKYVLGGVFVGKNDKKEKYLKDRDVHNILILIICMLLVIVGVAGIAAKSQSFFGCKISLDNWLMYFGTTIGVLMGGIITSAGLFLTLRINARQLLDQREIDNIRWENSNNQFKQQMKIQIINEKINDYKACNEDIGELIYSSRELNVQISKYKHDLYNFQVNIQIIKNPKLGLAPQPVKFKNQFNIFTDEYIKFTKLLEKVKMSSKCIYGEDIYNNIEKALDIWSEMQGTYREIFTYSCLKNITDNYSNYITNDKVIVGDLSEIQNLEEIIDKFIYEISNINKELSKCFDQIPKIICRLYEDKYSLNNSEQKMSNNSN